MSHCCCCYFFLLPSSSKNAQKSITLFPQSLPSSPQTLSSHPQIKKTHIAKAPQEVQELSEVEAPEALWLWRVPVLRFNNSPHYSSSPSKPVQEQGPTSSVFFLVSVLVPGELQSRTKWGVPAGTGTLWNWRRNKPSSGFVWVWFRGWRWIGWSEGWEVHPEFLPADENAEAGIALALQFHFTFFNSLFLSSQLFYSMFAFRLGFA